MQCEYASGVKMHFMGHRVAEPVVKAYHPAWCDHGTTFFGDQGLDQRQPLRRSTPATRRCRRPRSSRTKQHLTEAESQARNFVDCIKSRQPTVSPLESAIRSDTISHLSDICIRLGRPMQWDPQKEQIVGDAEASKCWTGRCASRGSSPRLSESNWRHSRTRCWRLTRPT